MVSWKTRKDRNRESFYARNACLNNIPLLSLTFHAVTAYSVTGCHCSLRLSC